MRTLVFYSAVLASASRRFYSPGVVSPGQHWSTGPLPGAAAMAAPPAVPVPQWEPAAPFAPPAELAAAEEMYYASYSPAHPPEYFYADSSPPEAPYASTNEYGGRYAVPLEDTAGSSSAAAELVAYFAAGSALGYSAYSALAVEGKERTAKDVAIGAAGLGGFLGVWLFGSVSWAAFGAVSFAYASTRNEALKKAGGAAAAAYDKAVEIDEEYLVAQKVKSATDEVIKITQNLNANYGWTSKIDEQLKLTERSSAVTAKLQGVKDAVDDFKAKATEAPNRLPPA